VSWSIDVGAAVDPLNLDATLAGIDAVHDAVVAASGAVAAVER